MTNLYGKNAWAVVTGATDGIGKAFTHSLAREGFNLILISRSTEKLKLCQQEIFELFPNVKTAIFTKDFGKEIELEKYKKELFPFLSQYDICILVNNVGCGGPNAFTDTKFEECYKTTVVNILPQVILSRFLVDHFLSRNSRSAIIDVSSATALNPYPYFSLYSSTKVFNDYLSRGLHAELKNKIDFLCLKPFGVSTNLIKVDKNLFVISSERVSEASLDRLGYETQSYGDWNHEIQGFFYQFIPQLVFDKINFSKSFEFLRKIAGSSKFSEK